MTTSYHVPVMLNASLEALDLDGDVEPRRFWMDATFGGVGTAGPSWQAWNERRLFGFDQDPDAAANALDDARFTLVAANFRFAPHPCGPTKACLWTDCSPIWA